MNGIKYRPYDEQIQAVRKQIEHIQKNLASKYRTIWSLQATEVTKEQSREYANEELAAITPYIQLLSKLESMNTSFNILYNSSDIKGKQCMWIYEDEGGSDILI